MDDETLAVLVYAGVLVLAAIFLLFAFRSRGDNRRESSQPKQPQPILPPPSPPLFDFVELAANFDALAESSSTLDKRKFDEITCAIQERPFGDDEFERRDFMTHLGSRKKWLLEQRWLLTCELESDGMMHPYAQVDEYDFQTKCFPVSLSSYNYWDGIAIKLVFPGERSDGAYRGMNRCVVPVGDDEKARNLRAKLKLCDSQLVGCSLVFKISEVIDKHKPYPFNFANYHPGYLTCYVLGVRFVLKNGQRWP